MDTDGSRSSSDAASTIILLIDGNDKDRTYYADRLKFSIPECVVLEAKTGQSGLELCRSRRIDCLVTELDLPDMSGFQLLVTVVPPASQPPLAVVILGRTSTPELVNLAKNSGAQAFLVKRLTAGDELAQVIQKAIALVGPTHKDRLGLSKTMPS